MVCKVDSAASTMKTILSALVYSVRLCFRYGWPSAGAGPRSMRGAELRSRSNPGEAVSPSLVFVAERHGRPMPGAACEPGTHTQDPHSKFKEELAPPDQLRKFPPHTGSGCPDHKSEPISTPRTSPRTSPTLASGSAEQGGYHSRTGAVDASCQIGDEPVPAILCSRAPIPASADRSLRHVGSREPQNHKLPSMNPASADRIPPWQMDRYMDSQRGHIRCLPLIRQPSKRPFGVFLDTHSAGRRNMLNHPPVRCSHHEVDSSGLVHPL